MPPPPIFYFIFYFKHFFEQYSIIKNNLAHQVKENFTPTHHALTMVKYYNRVHHYSILRLNKVKLYLESLDQILVKKKKIPN